MDLVIRTTLMLVFVQFLVIVSVMVAALLLARPEVPVLGREPGQRALKRSLAFAVDLPGRAKRSVGWVVHAAEGWRGGR